MPDPTYRAENGSSVPLETGVPRSRMGRRLLCSIAAIGGVILSLMFFALLLARERQSAQDRFLHETEEHVNAIRQAVNDRLDIVDSLAAFFSSCQLVESKEFVSFNGWLLEKHQSARALGWAPRIPAAKRRDFEQAVRKEGFPKFEITQWDPRGQLVAAGNREEYYPIRYIRPYQENQSLHGLDLGFDPAFGKILKQAIAGDRSVAIVGGMVDNRTKGSQLLYVLERARNERSESETRPADQPEYDGVVLGVFNVGAIIDTALALFPPADIDFYIVDSSGGEGEKFIFKRLSSGDERGAESNPGETVPELSPDKMHRMETIDVANETWKVVCIPTDDYCQRQRTWVPVGTLFAGLLITGLFTGLLAMLTGRTATVEKMVTKRTRELYESEQRFRRLVDNAGDAFFLHDEDGKILDVSRRACHSLGYTREELLAMTIADIDVHYISLNLMKHSKHRPRSIR
jgi:CHASE1-domain containing sensor protein